MYFPAVGFDAIRVSAGPEGLATTRSKCCYYSNPTVPDCTVLCHIWSDASNNHTKIGCRQTSKSDESSYVLSRGSPVDFYQLYINYDAALCRRAPRRTQKIEYEINEVDHQLKFAKLKTFGTTDTKNNDILDKEIQDRLDKENKDLLDKEPKTY
jgi:hypothetical protein